MSMDRQRRREGSQRAQAARAARQESRRKREQRSRLYVVVGVLAAASVVAAAFLLLRDTGPGLGLAVRELPENHGPPYRYDTSLTIDGRSQQIPPSSGRHGDASPYGFLGGPLIAESVVHNMEHGAVVIWYQPGDPGLAGDVNRLVRDLGQSCVVAGSFAQMTFAVAATVWGRVLPLDAFDREALVEFVREYRGKRGPEAGVCARS